MPLPPFANGLPALRLLPRRNSPGRNTPRAASQAGNVSQLLLRPARQNAGFWTLGWHVSRLRPRGATGRQEGFRSAAQSKPVGGENGRRSHSAASNAAEASTAAGSTLGTAADAARGALATEAHPPQPEGAPGLNVSICRMKRRAKSTTESRVFNSTAGEKTHLAVLNNLLHNVMICD